jgi:FkbM family methyltransferase
MFLLATNPKVIRIRGHIFPVSVVNLGPRANLELAQYSLRAFEQRSLHLVKRYLRKELTVIDVGSNIGIWISFLANVLGESSQVHAFEPNPTAQTFLKSFVTVNNLANINLHNLALSNSEGTANLFIDEDNATDPYASLNPGRIPNYIQVRTSTLDIEFDRFANAPELGFIKLDVEGFELEVLEGADSAIRRYMPDLCIEINMFSWATRKHSLLALEDHLKALDYILFMEKATSRGLKLEEIKTLPLLPDPVSNIHCFNRNRIKDLKRDELILL